MITLLNHFGRTGLPLPCILGRAHSGSAALCSLSKHCPGESHGTNPGHTYRMTSQEYLQLAVHTRATINPKVIMLTCYLRTPVTHLFLSKIGYKISKFI